MVIIFIIITVIISIVLHPHYYLQLAEELNISDVNLIYVTIFCISHFFPISNLLDIINSSIRNVYS